LAGRLRAVPCAEARNNDAYYLEWPGELVRRLPAALARVRQGLASQIDQVRFAQFLLFRQAERLKEYARSRGLHLIGDLPFFVSPRFERCVGQPRAVPADEQHRPRFVAGVPPDYFSTTGQLWGNPVYDWDAMRNTGYRWCIDRLRALLAHVDTVRLDHFRGFAAAWHAPAGALTAQSGQWVPGPGGEFFEAVRREVGGLPFVAEDLGLITPDVSALRDQFRLPGTRVLQFGFDGHSDNPHLPDNYISNTVVYTGTHDNPPTREWYKELPASQRHFLWRYLKRPEGRSTDAAPALIELAWSSAAALAIVPLQDVLNLGAEARMNVPGRTDGNWRWRCSEDMLTPTAFQWLYDLTKTSNRASFESNTLAERQGERP